MENLLIIKLIVALVGCAASMLMPFCGHKYACYKRKKKNAELPVYNFSKLIGWSIGAVAIGVVFCFYTIYNGYTLIQLVFHIIFYWVAVFATYVDAEIRIIGNEMLKAMLPLVLIYKILLGGGVQAVLGTLGGFAMVMSVFAAAAIFTFVRRGTIGVGMGDIKLAMIAGILVGWPGALNFLMGLGLAMIVYVMVMPYIQHKMWTLSYEFAMCMPIMAGILNYLINAPVFTKGW